MAQTKTLAQLRAVVLDRADMEYGGPVSTTQVDQRINAAIRRVFSALKKSHGDEYFSSDTTITTSSGTQEYDLPADFLNVSPEGVWWITGSTTNIPIHRYKPNESELQIAGQGWTYYPYGANIRYRIRGSKIRFVPTPLATYTIKLKYITAPPTLTDDSDTWDGYQGFEEAVLWLAAAYCLAKEEADASFQMGMFQQEMQNILEQAARDENEPDAVQWVDPILLYGDDYT